MEGVVVSAIVALAWLSVATCQVQLPCDSVLRRFPSLSRLFEHCETECHYGNWTDVTPVANARPIAVPFHQCRSELALPGEKWQRAINNSDECIDRWEGSYICSSTCRYSDWMAIPHVNATPTTVAVPLHQCSSGQAIPRERQRIAAGYECTANQCKICEDQTEQTFICSIACQYSNWTEVTPYVNASPIMVPLNQCRSGLVLLGERWQISLIEGYECTEDHCEKCQDKIEERYLCEPTMTQRLITLFELGRAGQDWNGYQTMVKGAPVHGNTSLNSTNDSTARYELIIRRDHDIDSSGSADLTPPEKMCSSKQVCQSHQQVKKRYSDSKEKEQPHVKSQRLTAEPEPLPTDPIPFDIFKHGKRYRRQNNVKCYGTRYVLFMLDTSGSIEEENFQMMTSALSTLVHHFCRPVKIAAFTFNEEQFLEFCFNCYDNDCPGHDMARDAMAGIKYCGGLTYTGEATQCVCDFILSPDCGFPDLFQTEKTTCLDVIYVTDGQSNGQQNVCQKVDCLYNLKNMSVELNVFAFGIGEYDVTELKCITKDRSFNSIGNKIFEVDSFDELAEAINLIGHAFDILHELNINEQEVPDCFAIDATDGVWSDDCRMEINNN